jgi:VWFA-related protein
LGYTQIVASALCTTPGRAASFLATLLLSVCAWTALSGQEPRATAEADRTAIRLDVVVTDAQGRAILDLRPSDFELLENGAVKPLDAVELRTLPRDPDTAPIETASAEERAARQPGTRVFAFFLDEFHVSPGAAADRARAAVAAFVDEKLRPQDLAVVMKPLDPVTSIRFTRDRAVLQGAIAGFDGRKGEYAPRTPFEAQFIGRAPAAVARARRQIVTAGLRELTIRLGDLKADRAVLVLVSEGFARDTPAPRSRGADLHGVVRASSRFNLAAYTFNPATSEEDVAPAAERERAVATLQWLATQTGGRAAGAEALVAGFARLAHDLEAYYALSYQPAQADGRFQEVEIRAKRRNVLVHARPGYWAPLGTEWRALLTSASTSMLPMSRRALRRSPAIDAWVGLVRDPDGRARMVITWEPRARGISAPTVVALKARTTTGTLLFDGRLGGVGSGSTVPSDSARFEVPPGRVELDMTIYDAEGKSVDTDARDVDVPDFKAPKRGPVILSPEVVRARTLRDFRAASINPEAAPSPVRTFARGDRLLIRVPAFDGSGTAVQVSAKVLNERGHPMRDIDPLEGSTTPEGISQFALPLSWLVPGDYLIEVMGTNANGAVKQRVAFTVTG